MKKRKRRRFKALTPIAKALYRALYDEPWPSGWTVGYVGFMRGALGLTDYDTKRILLSWGDRRKHNMAHTLVHEFTHVRWRLRHGAEFERLVDSAYARIWT